MQLVMKTLQRTFLFLPLLLAVVGCDGGEQDDELPAADRLAKTCLDVCVDGDCDRCDSTDGVLVVDAETAPIVGELLGLETLPELPEVGSERFTAPAPTASANHYGLLCAYSGNCYDGWMSQQVCAWGDEFGIAYSPWTWQVVYLACDSN